MFAKCQYLYMANYMASRYGTITEMQAEIISIEKTTCNTSSFF